MIKATITISQKFIWSDSGFYPDFPWDKDASENRLCEYLESALRTPWLDPHVSLSTVDNITTDPPDNTGVLTDSIRHEIASVWQEFEWLVRKDER